MGWVHVLVCCFNHCFKCSPTADATEIDMLQCLATKQQMHVRIDEAWRDDTTTRIDRHRALTRLPMRRPDTMDTPMIDMQRGRLRCNNAAATTTHTQQGG